MDSGASAIFAFSTRPLISNGCALPDLAGECFEIVRFAREHGDGIGRSEASDE
jgi:hypothetical protein